MDENLLKKTFELISNDNENEFPQNTSVDLFDFSITSLEEAGITYKKIPKKNKRGKNPYLLRLFNSLNEPFLDFNKGFYPNNVKVGKLIANDKYLTERFLKYSGVKTPETMLLKENEMLKAESLIKEGKGNFVIKPKDLSHALGAFRNVDGSNFKECWNKSINVQKKYKVNTPLVIVQKQVEGIELRVTVTEGIVDTVSMRAPGFIVGDGKSTIEELINQKNINRKRNIYHYKNPLKINKDLENDLKLKGRNLESVPSKNEYLILYPRTNISIGRENYEITDYVKPTILEQAMEAVIAIPGIHTAGVDIIVDSLDADEGTVIEVNQNPAFQVNYFPMYGSKQDPLKKIFSSLLLENEILNNRINVETLTQDKLEIILEKFKFLYSKNKALEKEIEILLMNDLD